MKQRRPGGLNPLDILSLSQDQADLVTWLTRRREATLAEAEAELGERVPNLADALATLAAAGYVEQVDVDGQSVYRVRFGERPASINRRLPDDLWSQLSGRDTLAHADDD